jgi:hypothetical protein
MQTTSVEITIEASTVAHLESFLTMCKLAGVPSDTIVHARTGAPRRQLRQLAVKAASVVPLDGPEAVLAAVTTREAIAEAVEPAAVDAP